MLTSTPLGTLASRPGRTIVTSMEVVGDQTRLGSSAGGRPRQVTIDETPDREQARRWLGTFRRVGHIEVRIHDGTASCRVYAVGHRLPTSRRVSLATGLGMGQLGVPVLVTEEAR